MNKVGFQSMTAIDGRPLSDATLGFTCNVLEEKIYHGMETKESSITTDYTHSILIKY